MARALTLSLVLALPLAGCGPKTLALSDEPVTRAAQCGAVAASAARVSQADVKAPLPFPAQAAVLQHALLTATGGDGYDADRAAAVLKALPEAGKQVSSAKWQALQPACDAAFPQVKAPAVLPAAALDAQLGCSVLAGYVEGAMQSQEALYAEALTPIRRMRLALDDRIGAKLHRAGQTDGAGQKGSRDRAMNAIAHAGGAAAVLDACVARYKA